MKKIFNYFCSTVLCLGLTSCSKDIASSPESENPEVAGEMTIIANTESNDTRASLEGDDATGYKVVWNTGDEIGLYTEDGRRKVYTLTGGAGTTKGEFTGKPLVDGTHYEAYYGDYDIIPALQVYYPQNKIPLALMRAMVTVQSGVPTIADFKNLCGILRLDIKGTGQVSGITIMTDQYISGPYTINSNDCAVVGNDKSHNFKKIDLAVHESLVQLSESKSEPFYIVLPQGDYTGLKIWITERSGEICYKALKAGKTLSIKRSQITPVSLTCNEYIQISGSAKNPYFRDVNCFQLWDGGPKFAEFNVGGSPTDKGKLYYWDDMYSWGNAWRLPTGEELWDGLTEKCDITVTTVNGMDGKLFTGRGMYSINSIFLPFAGAYDKYLDVTYSDHAAYWCSDPASSNGYAYLTISRNTSGYRRGYEGMKGSIRYVLK